MANHRQGRPTKKRSKRKRKRSLEGWFKVVSLAVIVVVVRWNVFLFGNLAAMDNHHKHGEPTFSLSHPEECVQSPTNAKNTANSTTILKLPTGLVVTVLSFDKKNPQLWNSICTLFPSQLTHFIVPHQLDVFLLLYGTSEHTEQDLVDCMDLQRSPSNHEQTWTNFDGSTITTRDYLAMTVIAGTPYKTTIKIAVQPTMDVPNYIQKETRNVTQFLQDHPIQPPMCQAPVEYIQGTRWYTNQLLHLQLLKNYEYWIKMDPDIVFVEPLKLNLLFDMKQRGAVFGHTGEYPPGAPTPCADGLGLAVETFLKESQHTCAIPNTPLLDADRYYTNLIIGRVDFFQSNQVRNFGRWLSEYPKGFFHHRWTDQIFWHAAMQLYLWDYPKYIVDYTDFRCSPVKNCWMSALDLKLYQNVDNCQNGGLFVHTKHALHWAHRWNRYHARKPYDLTSQASTTPYESKYQHDCRVTRWRGSGGSSGLRQQHPLIK